MDTRDVLYLIRKQFVATLQGRLFKAVYGPGAPSNRRGRTFVPRLSEDASVSVAGDNKVYSAPIQSIKEKLWGQESCKLNRSTRLAFARSANSRSVKINH